MKKVLHSALLIAALLFTSIIFGCNNGNNSNSSSDDNPTTEIVFQGQTSLVTYKAFFVSDDTFRFTSAVGSYAEEIEYTGTYTGDVSKDGVVEITILEQRKDHNGNMEDYTGSNPVQNLNIANGKFTFDGTEYTRQ